VPGGALTPRLFNLKIGDRIWLSQKAGGKFTYDDSRVPKGAEPGSDHHQFPASAPFH